MYIAVTAFANIEIKNVNADMKSILEAVSEAENKKVTPGSYFGDGNNSSEKFFQIIKEDNIWKVSLQKQFIDLDV